MKRVLRDNSLSLVLLVLFVLFLAGQAIALASTWEYLAIRNSGLNRFKIGKANFLLSLPLSSFRSGYGKKGLQNPNL